MTIEMLENRAGSPDGKSVSAYQAGRRYRVPQDIPEDLAGVFIENRWARKCEPELKDKGFSEEHKNAGRAPQNKSLFENVIARIRGN